MKIELMVTLFEITKLNSQYKILYLLIIWIIIRIQSSSYENHSPGKSEHSCALIAMEIYPADFSIDSGTELKVKSNCHKCTIFDSF